MKKSKRYTELLSKVPENPVDLDQAISILKGFEGTKFDQTIEIHMQLGIDPKQADQIVSRFGRAASRHWKNPTRRCVRQRRRSQSR